MTRRKAITPADELPPPPDWTPPPAPEPFVQRDGIEEALEARRRQRDDPAARRRAFNPYTFGERNR